MLSLFWQLNGRDLSQNGLRSLLSIIGIALGVSIVLAMNIANHSAVEQFKAGLLKVAGTTTHEIVSQVGPHFNESALNELTFLWPANAQFSPVLEDVAIHPTQNEVYRVLGVDMLSNAQVSEAQWANGGKPDNAFTILNARQVYIGKDFAKRQALALSDTFNVLMNEREVSVEVAGILSPEGLGGAYSGNLLLMDIGAMQAAYSVKGQLSRVDLELPEASAPDLITQMTATLPKQLTVQTPARRSERVDQLLSSYHLNLSALSLIALIVGGFLIYNTMAITVVRRRPTIGSLRALGATRGQVASCFLLEAGLLGLVGSGLGVGLGLWLAQFAVEAISSTVQIIYTGQAVQQVSVPDWMPWTALGLGVGFTLLAALAPTLEAASVHPAEATRPASIELRVSRWSLPLFLLGLALEGVAVWAAYMPLQTNEPAFGYVASTVGILGAALLVPFLLRLLAPLVGKLLNTFVGPEGKLAAVGLVGSLGRSSVAVASLMIAIAMLVSLLLMIGSFRQTVRTWVNQSLRADVFIQPLAGQISRGAGAVTVSTVNTIRSVPGVAAIDPFYETELTLNEKPAKLGVGDFDTFARYGNVQFVDGEAFESVLQRVRVTGNAGVVSEPLAIKHNLHKGDKVDLPTPSGLMPITIEGIYYDYASEQGYLVIPRRLYRQWFEAPQSESVNSVAVYLAEGVSAASVRDVIAAKLPKEARLTLRTNSELKAEVLRIFNQTFAITYGLEAIALIVSFLTVMNTLFALVLENQRDLGVFRYLGASVEQVKRLVLTQALMLGSLGFLFGGALGYGLALLLIYVINRVSFGWSIFITWPWVELGGALVLILLVSWASGVIPARWAAQLKAPSVIRAE